MNATAVRAPAVRWAILTVYALLAACTQLLWLTFAAIDTDSARVLHVDVGTVGDLAAIFPFIYVVLALPVGRWLDARFAHALGVGAMLTGGGAVIRILAPSSFGVQLAGQVVIAAGQPFVLNSITKVAARYFPQPERATAISIGSVALFVGILASVLIAAPLFSAGGLGLVVVVEAVPSVVGAALMLLVLRVPAIYPDDASTRLSMRWLVRDRFMWLLAGLIFIGMGVYNAVATWLQPVLANFGEGGAAGNLIAVLTAGGIAGAAVLPSIVAARNVRRSMLVVALAFSALAFVATDVRHDIAWLGIWLFATGFAIMACLPVVLDWSAIHAGIAREGAAAGFLLMSGNLGGVVLVLVIQGVMGNAYLPLGALAVISLLGLPLALGLPGRSDVSGRAIATFDGER
ncbi:MAG TPA: MFS transporter [Candidatus Saccharimonadales bacterium]|nr:MFS transporter [Candidatus Saccharimonadales bacterium]